MDARRRSGGRRRGDDRICRVQNAWYRRHHLLARCSIPGWEDWKSTRVRGCHPPLQLIRPFISNGLPNARAISQPFWRWWRPVPTLSPDSPIGRANSPPRGGCGRRQTPIGRLGSGLRDGGWPLFLLVEQQDTPIFGASKRSSARPDEHRTPEETSGRKSLASDYRETRGTNWM